ncbi:hypothetical protein ACUH9Y_09000 [Dermabacteraceae bacterium P13115]
MLIVYTLLIIVGLALTYSCTKILENTFNEVYKKYTPGKRLGFVALLGLSFFLAIHNIASPNLQNHIIESVFGGDADTSGQKVAKVTKPNAQGSQNVSPAKEEEVQTSQPPEEPALTEEESGDSAQPSPPELTGPLRTSLLSLNHVNVDTNNDIDLRVRDSINVNGETLGPVLTYSCSLYCNGSSPQIRQFVLGGKFASLRGTLFVLDSSSDSHQVTFYNDDALIQENVVSPGEPISIDLDVTGVSRLTVVFYAPGPLKSPLQAGIDTTSGNNGGGLPGVALVEPSLFSG